MGRNEPVDVWSIYNLKTLGTGGKFQADALNWTGITYSFIAKYQLHWILHVLVTVFKTEVIMTLY
jgi:hypothetical protein